MPRRRNDLKDSDSEDSDNGGDERTVTSDIADIFTDKEIEAINKCKIQTNDNRGIYSDDFISRAIAKVGMPPLELAIQDGAVPLYQKYRVNDPKEFYDRAIYKVHGAKSHDCNPECVEESILLEIETIRRSEKAVKVRLFKNKDTGGMVVFGPWFNYALQRLLQLSSKETGRSATAESSSEDYTAVKIIRSLFTFITEDLKEVIKPGKLLELKTKMGVDWDGNMKAARKVINYCGGSAHFLHKELTIVEAYVESLKSISQKKSTAAADSKSPASNTAAERAPSRQADANDGRKKRMEAMKAHATAYLPGQPAAPSHTSVAASLKAQATAYLPGQPVAPSHTSVAASPPANDGWGRSRAGESAARESSTTEPHNFSRATIATGNQPFNPNDRAASQSNDHTAPSLGSATNGWGRVRDGKSAIQPLKTRGSWSFARSMLGANIPVSRPVNNAQNFDNPTPQQEAFARAPGQLPVARAASRDNFSTRDDHAHDLNRRSENRSGDMNDPPSRSDNYSSRSVGNASFGRYEDRGSGSGRDDRSYHQSGSRGGGRDDYPRSNSDSREGSSSRDTFRGEEHRSSNDRDPGAGRDDRPFNRSNSRGGGREDYPRSNSREGIGRRDTHRGEEHRSSSSRDGSYRDHSGHPAQGYKHTRSDDYDGRDARPEKMYKADSAGASMGRGAHVNQPAWKKQMQTSAHDGPTGMSGDLGVTTNPYAAMAGANINYTSSLIAPGSAAGRGMDTKPPASNSLSNLGRFVPAPGSTAPAPAIAQHSVGESTTNGHGRGRGRGRGVDRTRPAWMTTESNQRPQSGRGAEEGQYDTTNMRDERFEDRRE
jgi:hypothetical protein